MKLDQLIERAVRNVGSQRALAALLGAREQHVSNWKNGSRPCSLEIQARIAELAGEDAKEWVWQAVRQRMQRVAATVAALTFAVLLGTLGAPGVAQAAEHVTEARQCIRRLLRRLVSASRCYA